MISVEAGFIVIVQEVQVWSESCMAEGKATGMLEKSLKSWWGCVWTGGNPHVVEGSIIEFMQDVVVKISMRQEPIVFPPLLTVTICAIESIP